MRVWHYTTWEAFENIGESGMINTTSAGIEYNEKPAVWFSTNPDWDKSVRKILIDRETGKQTFGLARDELWELGFNPVRIEVDPGLPFLSWHQFKKKSGTSKIMAKELEQQAKEWGANPDEWLALFSPVSQEHWLVIEIWDGQAWKVKYNRDPSRFH